MKTASILDLGSLLPKLMQWIGAGEDVLLTEDGRVVARLTPETDMQQPLPVNWADTPEVTRDRGGETRLTAAASARIIAEAAGRW